MIMDTGIITDIILVIGGIIAGLFSGLLGIGGGTILVPIQYNLLTEIFLIDPDIALRTAFATSLAVTLPTALSSAYGHYKKGMIIWRIGLIAGLCGFLGGISGGFIASIISAAILVPLFACVMFVMAGIMIVSKSNQDIDRCNLKSFPYIISGFLVGIISGMIGIGGGIILAPILIIFCRMPSRVASATTSLFVIAASTGGLISYIIMGGQIPEMPFFTIGYLNLNWWIILVIITVPMAQVGVYLLHRFDPWFIKYVFILLLLYLSVDMLGFW